MALTLEQYATYLDTRDLPWPAPPTVERVKARPHLEKLHGLKVVLWNVYGTLLAIPGGELLFEHPIAFVMSAALEKTIQEFKMWGSMSRKPGQPSEYMGQIYSQILLENRAALPGEKYPDVASEKVWEAILMRLIQKDYKFDVGFFGSLNELSRKVAYFFHASLQGTAAYPGAAEAMKFVHEAGLAQGLLADGQCFTTVQLQRGLTAQDASAKLDTLLDKGLIALSYELRGKKPSERLFRHTLAQLQAKGIESDEVLHVGSRLVQDIGPAKRLGMRTALFAGDKASLQASAEQLKDNALRPDVLLTELTQIAEVVGES
jgi:FMN phosphatase YigB (HAD superfamily)